MFRDYDKIPHTGIQSLNPYTPGKSVEALAEEQCLTNILKLASNENPLGCSDAVATALNSLTPAQIATYSITAQNPLHQKLANHLHIEPDMLLLSNGSDAIFSLALICFALHSGKRVVTHQAAFIQYQIQAKILGIPMHHVPIKSNWEVDIDALIAACTEDTAMLFLANPNNPTGLLIPRAEIMRMLEQISSNIIVVLDEAYYEYVSTDLQSSTISLLSKHQNLIITRTFSKAYGLAALRLGYAIAHPILIALLYRIQNPFFVNKVASIAASAALDDQAFIEQTLNTNRDGKKQMQAGFKQLNLIQLPSACNFITIDLGYDALTVDQNLQRHGIIVRPLNAYGLNHHLRVTIGTAAQNARFLITLTECLNGISYEHGTESKAN